MRHATNRDDTRLRIGWWKGYLWGGVALLLNAYREGGRPRGLPHRHSVASNALAAGEDPARVARMLGHKSAKVLFEVYARVIRNRTRQGGSALAARLGTLGLPDAGEMRTTPTRPRATGSHLRELPTGFETVEGVGAEGGI